MTVYLVERPDHYDVIVMENMFGDIMSDLAAATVGSMGMSPSAELGEATASSRRRTARRRPSPARTSPIPTAPSFRRRSMLQWLGERHADQRLTATADQIEKSVEAAMKSPDGLTRDLGGKATTSGVSRLVIDGLGQRLQRATPAESCAIG